MHGRRSSSAHAQASGWQQSREVTCCLLLCHKGAHQAYRPLTPPSHFSGTNGPSGPSASEGFPEVQRKFNQVIRNLLSPMKMHTRKSGRKRTVTGVVLLPGHEEKEEAGGIGGALLCGEKTAGLSHRPSPSILPVSGILPIL